MINLAEAGLSFVEGLALIASPCILPVLPLVLSGGIDGGKARPFGITLGFVTAFSIFVLASRQIVALFHINPDILRDVSLGFLFLLGLVMLSEKLSGWFSRATQKFANAGSSIGGDRKGFVGGILIGALIGLVWTPCAGPILASVLVLVIRQQTDAQSIAITLAFAVGAALPMLVITLAGRQVMQRARFLTRHTEAIRKIFAVLILLAVGFMALGSTATNLFASGGPAEPTTATALEDGLKQPYPAPEFAGIKSWINSAPLTMQSLRGKVVLIDFWTYSCINCVRTLPYITAWDAKYRDQGLVIIGVHSPEFEFEKDVGNIKTAVAKYGIKYPVAVDSDLDTWTAYNNQYWPAHYLIDKDGQVVYTHFGEGGYDRTENNIRYLLGLKGEAEANAPMATPLRGETPETYLGYGRGERFTDRQGVQRDIAAGYQAPSFVPLNQFALGGQWKIGEEKITSAEKGALLRLNFKAKKVFLVMGTADGKPRQVELKLNGAPLSDKEAGTDVKKSSVTITGHALYELVDLPSADNALLEITSNDPGAELYAFTFGE